jgi:hypothetical protein
LIVAAEEINRRTLHLAAQSNAYLSFSPYRIAAKYEKSNVFVGPRSCNPH